MAMRDDLKRKKMEKTEGRRKKTTTYTD